MANDLLSALIAGMVAILLSYLTNRARTKAVAGKKAAEVIAAETARRKVLAELDDIAMDRAARINETIIDGLNMRIDLLQDEQQWAEQVIFTLRGELEAAGIPMPALPPRPVRRHV